MHLGSVLVGDIVQHQICFHKKIMFTGNDIRFRFLSQSYSILPSGWKRLSLGEGGRRQYDRSQSRHFDGPSEIMRSMEGDRVQSCFITSLMTSVSQTAGVGKVMDQDHVGIAKVIAQCGGAMTGICF